jgi:hypothetical protein
LEVPYGSPLGDLGTAEDADLILGRIGRERDNNFALAELCIAGSFFDFF